MKQRRVRVQIADVKKHHREVINVLDIVLADLARVHVWLLADHPADERRRDLDHANDVLRGMRHLHAQELSRLE